MPRLADFGCGGGGASYGYAQAGWEVTGVDIDPQHRRWYPFEFVCADALDVLADTRFMRRFSAVHLSLPCQRYSRMSNCRPGLAATYPDLIGPARDLVLETGLPYVMENVPGAPLRPDVELCAWSFGYEHYRHRLFESSTRLTAPPHRRHVTPASKAGHWRPGTFMSIAGHCAPIAQARKLMAIHWRLPREVLVEAIPPYFACHLGTQLIQAV